MNKENKQTKIKKGDKVIVSWIHGKENGIVIDNSYIPRTGTRSGSKVYPVKMEDGRIEEVVARIVEKR